SDTTHDQTSNLALLLFLFTRTAAPRDLPPFPTRRSSDLGARAERQGRLERHDQIGTCAARRLEPAHRVLQHRHHPRLESAGGARDRKSTRLNSSHVSISYAVFCLKKKKNSKYEPFSLSDV